jgi:hypothetical protein
MLNADKAALAKRNSLPVILNNQLIAFVVSKVKSKLSPGAVIIKLFTVVVYSGSQ